MDARTLRDLRRLAPARAAAREGAAAARVRPGRRGAGDLDVPDPYYGGDDGFGDVLDLVERACRGLLDELRERSRA